jgi:hypothetical protein
VDKVEEIIKEDPHATIRDIEDMLNISHGSVYKILTVNLQLTSLCSRWVPHALTADQKQQRVIIAKE